MGRDGLQETTVGTPGRHGDATRQTSGGERCTDLLRIVPVGAYDAQGMSEAGVSGIVTSVNVGMPRSYTWLGREVVTAIRKAPVPGRVAVRGVNVDGDDQADRRVHGGPDKAVYAYAVEDAAAWSAEMGRALGPGALGENLTVRGLDLSAAVLGSRWRVGSAVLRVAGPRIPCLKLGLAMDDRHFPRRFARAGRPGTYLAIEEPGEVGAGDVVRVVDVPAHGVTAGLLDAAYHRDRARWAEVPDVDDLPAGWRAMAAEQRARLRQA